MYKHLNYTFLSFHFPILKTIIPRVVNIDSAITMPIA